MIQTSSNVQFDWKKFQDTIVRQLQQSQLVWQQMQQTLGGFQVPTFSQPNNDVLLERFLQFLATHDVSVQDMSVAPQFGGYGTLTVTLHVHGTGCSLPHIDLESLDLLKAAILSSEDEVLTVNMRDLGRARHFDLVKDKPEEALHIVSLTVKEKTSWP